MLTQHEACALQCCLDHLLPVLLVPWWADVNHSSKVHQLLALRHRALQRSCV